MVAKLIGILVGIIILLWVISVPEAAGHAVHNFIVSIITFASAVGH